MSRRPLIAIAVVSLALLVSGCSSDAKPGASPSASSAETTEPTASATPSETTVATPTVDELITNVQQTIDSATSVHVVGSLERSGSTIAIDVRGNRDGTYQQATVTVGSGKATILTVDGVVYLQADQAFLDSQGLASLGGHGDKYVTSEAVTKAFSSKFNVGGLLSTMRTGTFDAENVDPNIESADLQGRPMFIVKEKASDARMWVSADGKWELTQASGTVDGGAMSLTFSEWNAVPRVQVPPADQVVSL